jgi:hypothetical protein
MRKHGRLRPRREVSFLRAYAVMGLGAILLAAALSAPALLAGEEKEKAVVSGFQVGERTPAFDVVDVCGPNKGKQLCYV